MDLTDEEWNDFRSLDLGCGIGRHVKFLDEFGLNPFGIDLSDTAISIGKDWFGGIGRKDLAERLIIGSVTDLPYEDESFWICVSHGVLDSMSREIAIKGMQELFRVMKPKGLMYPDLIMDIGEGKDKDVIIDFGYEKDTVQSYFTIDTIKKFLGESIEIVDLKVITYSDENGNETNKRARLIVQKK